MAISNADTNMLYEYDSNGNLTKGDGKVYEYNDANKLVRIRHGDQNGVVIAEYYYDFKGQRIKKIENEITTYYIGKNYVTEIADSLLENTKYYFANKERVAKKDSSGNLSYFHSDHLGGTNAVTDSGGNLVERNKYYPFGEIREGGQERFTYTGKEKDKLTDFYYFEARYYKHEFKHFTQPDAISRNLYDPQDLNRYTYVNNNPVKYVDPSGHKKQYRDYKTGQWTDEPNERAQEIMDKLSKTARGKKILSEIEAISEKKDIYIDFIKHKEVEHGVAGIEGIHGHNPDIPDDGSYFVYLNKVYFKGWFNLKKAARVLGHEFQHILDIDKAVSQGYDFSIKAKDEKMEPALESHADAVTEEIQQEQKTFVNHFIDAMQELTN